MLELYAHDYSVLSNILQFKIKWIKNHVIHRIISGVKISVIYASFKLKV